MLQTITDLFERDLNKLINEIESYSDDKSIWLVEGRVSNSAGNLILHLIGNLNHFIGATLGNTGYVRNRENEFLEKNVARTKLVADTHDTIAMIKQVLERLSDDDLEEDYPHAFNNNISSTTFVLMHLLGHLSYHLGQINYHRRLIG